MSQTVKVTSMIQNGDRGETYDRLNWRADASQCLSYCTRRTDAARQLYMAVDLLLHLSLSPLSRSLFLFLPSHSSSPMTTSERAIASSTPSWLMKESTRRPADWSTGQMLSLLFSFLSSCLGYHYAWRETSEFDAHSTQLLSLFCCFALTIAFLYPINRSPVNDIFHCASCDLMLPSVRCISFTVQFSSAPHLQA